MLYFAETQNIQYIIKENSNVSVEYEFYFIHEVKNMYISFVCVYFIRGLAIHKIYIFFHFTHELKVIFSRNICISSSYCMFV